MQPNLNETARTAMIKKKGPPLDGERFGTWVRRNYGDASLTPGHYHIYKKQGGTERIKFFDDVTPGQWGYTESKIKNQGGVPVKEVPPKEIAYETSAIPQDFQPQTEPLVEVEQETEPSPESYESPGDAVETPMPLEYSENPKNLPNYDPYSMLDPNAGNQALGQATRNWREFFTSAPMITFIAVFGIIGLVWWMNRRGKKSRKDDE
jgi:hypothetical protein